MHELHRHEVNGRNCNRDIAVKLMGNWSIITSGSSLERISALGVEGGICVSSLRGVLGSVKASFLVYKTKVLGYTTRALHLRSLFSSMLMLGRAKRMIVK